MADRPPKRVVLELPLDQVILRSRLERRRRQLMVVGTGEDDDRHIGQHRAHHLNGRNSRRIRQ
ncbi:MAG: hypothetical protein AW07_04790 [Candidatus Accumulibacter sp. SK-11]|nr:MAG: hypothetical protein AW07_04790 [Candidatus Accumulibacter sp. SK-11]